MKLNERNIRYNSTAIPLFLLILYFAMLPLKDIIYFNEALVPITLILAIVMLTINKDFRVIDTTGIVNMQYIYLISVLVVVVNNVSISTEIISGGVIQYILLCIFIYVMKYKKNWIELMYKIMLLFFVIHAVATLVFAVSPEIYRRYVLDVFPAHYQILMNNYNIGRVAGLCTNYSTNGIYLAIGTGISFVYLLSNRKKAFTVILFLLMAAALLASGKRAHLIFTAFACIIIYFVFNSGKDLKKYLKFISIGGGIVVAAFVGMSFVPELANTINRFAELFEDVTGGRSILYKLAIKMFTESPLIGCGWGSYKYRANESVIGLIYGRDSDMLVHNVYLQLLAETGIIGFLIFTIMFILGIKLTWGLLRKSRKNIAPLPGYAEIALAASLFIQIFFVLYCLTGNALYDYPMLFPYMMSCAVPVAIKFQMFKKERADAKIRNTNVS